MKGKEGCAMMRPIGFLLAACMAAGAAWAADDPMVGDWKLNPRKSKLTDEMKVTSLGGNKYSFDFGGGAMVAAADGTDQPGTFGMTIAVKIDGPARWTVVRKKDGKVLVTGIWTLSSDGSKLNDHYTAVRPSGGTTSLDYVYERRGNGQGFAGDWVSTTEQVNSAFVMHIKPFEGDGLSFITPGGAGTKNIRFDGKDYANVGAVVDGLAASAQRVNERTVRVTDTAHGKLTDTQEVTVSDDGKTLTITIHVPGHSEDDVQVFERQ
jgi:hypothetical protein